MGRCGQTRTGAVAEDNPQEATLLWGSAHRSQELSGRRAPGGPRRPARKALEELDPCPARL